MTTSARLLLDFFEADSVGKSPFTFSELYRAILDIEENVAAWKAAGTNVAPFEAALPSWRAEIRSHASESLTLAPHPGTTLQPSDLGVLYWVEDRLNNSVLMRSADDSDPDPINALLDRLRSAVTEDDSLPQDLRFHIAKLILHVRECLDGLAVYGEFALSEALERLFGAMRTAEATSKKPTLWSEAWVKFGIPVAIALTSDAGKVAINYVQMLALGTGGAQ